MTGPRIPRDFPTAPQGELPVPAELKLHPEVSGLLRDAALAILPVLIAFLTRLLTKGRQ